MAWYFEDVSSHTISLQIGQDSSNRLHYGMSSFSMTGPTGWFLHSPGFRDSRGDPELDSSPKNSRLALENQGSGDVTGWLGGIFAVPKPDKGYLVLNWDDANAERYDEAYQDMLEFGYPGVSSVPTGQVGTAKRLSINEMVEMRDELGWEFVSHTHNNINLLSKSDEEIRREFDLSRRWLFGENERNVRFVPEDGLVHIVFPFVNFDGNIKDIASDYFDMAAGNSGNQKHAMATKGFDPIVLDRMVGLKLSNMKRFVDLLAIDRQAGIINLPNFGAKNTVSRSEFQSFLSYLGSNYTSTGQIEVITLSDMYRLRTDSG